MAKACMYKEYSLLSTTTEKTLIFEIPYRPEIVFWVDSLVPPWWSISSFCFTLICHGRIELMEARKKKNFSFLGFYLWVEKSIWGFWETRVSIKFPPYISLSREIDSRGFFWSFAKFRVFFFMKVTISGG